MSKKKPVSKYSDLLEFSGNKDDRYFNKIFICDKSQCVAATNGVRLLARRDLYPEIKVLARLIGSPDTKVLTPGPEGTLEVSKVESYNNPDIDAILPNASKLKTGYKRLQLLVPLWVADLSKNTKGVDVSIILNDIPLIALGGGYDNSRLINLNLLKPFAGQEIDAYVSTPSSGETGPGNAFVFLPCGASFDVAPWFSLAMPMRDSKQDKKPLYV